MHVGGKKNDIYLFYIQQYWQKITDTASNHALIEDLESLQPVCMVLWFVTRTALYTGRWQDICWRKEGMIGENCHQTLLPFIWCLVKETNCLLEDLVGEQFLMISYLKPGHFDKQSIPRSDTTGSSIWSGCILFGFNTGKNKWQNEAKHPLNWQWTSLRCKVEWSTLR